MEIKLVELADIISDQRAIKIAILWLVIAIIIVILSLQGQLFRLERLIDAAAAATDGEIFRLRKSMERENVRKPTDAPKSPVE